MERAVRTRSEIRHADIPQTELLPLSIIGTLQRRVLAQGGQPEVRGMQVGSARGLAGGLGREWRKGNLKTPIWGSIRNPAGTDVRRGQHFLEIRGRPEYQLTVEQLFGIA